jgi:phosphoglycolate phosphatase
MRYEAIVFDLDGTVLDTIEDLCDAVNYAMDKYNLSNITIAQTKSYLGWGIRHLVFKAIGYERSDFEEILSCFKNKYDEICDNKTRPFDGIYELLSYCKENNIKCAIASNKIQSAVDILCEKWFGKYMSIFVGEGDGRLRKPEPDIVNHACKLLEVNPKNILYVGDSEVDITTVSNIGCSGAFVSYGFRTKEELSAKTDEVIFESPYELLAWIKKIN